MRVLIADGDKVFLEVAQRYLSYHGHEVNIATNGLESVAILRRFVPSAVVLDYELLWGGSDGVLALMQQDSKWSTIPVILTSDGVSLEEFGNAVLRPDGTHTTGTSRAAMLSLSKPKIARKGSGMKPSHKQDGAIVASHALTAITDS